jgi:hypothetical protein
VLRSPTIVYPPLRGKIRALAATLILILSVSLMLALRTNPAHACTPPAGGLPKHTVEDRISAAEVVLEGKVAAVSVEGIPYSATVEVHQYFKSSGPATVEISGFGPSSLCLSSVGVGYRYIFYTTRHQSDELRAHYLSQFDAVDPADPKTVAEVMAAVAQDKETENPTPSPTATATLTPTPSPTAPTEPTTTPEPTATPTQVVVARAEQTASSESSAIAKDTPSSGGACSALTHSGSRVVDLSAIAVILGLVGLAVRRRPKL